MKSLGFYSQSCPKLPEVTLPESDNSYFPKLLNKKPSELFRRVSNWVQGLDLNQRPSGYEPDELPGCSTLQQWGENGAGRRWDCQIQFPYFRRTLASALPAAGSSSAKVTKLVERCLIRIRTCTALTFVVKTSPSL